MVDWFNDKWKRAIETGIYECPLCGSPMEFEDEDEDVLICINCGHDMPAEQYGYTDEEWEKFQEEAYPTVPEDE